MPLLDSQILSQVSDIAGALPPSIIDGFCSELENSDAVSDFGAVLAAIERIPDARAREMLLQLHNTSCASPTTSVSPHLLAVALRSSCIQEQRWRTNQKTDLVWTGPVIGRSFFRRTDQALLDVIGTATKDLILVTFAAYKIPEIKSAIIAAAKRGVAISIILESAEESDGKVTFNALHALGKEVEQRATIYMWPKHQRPADIMGHIGALHAKCAVADGRVLFLSSANLTDHAFNLNMELGVIITGGELPERVSEHFKVLMHEEIISRIGG